MNHFSLCLKRTAKSQKSLQQFYIIILSLYFFYFFLMVKQLIPQMRTVPARHHQDSDSSQSYGHEFRLKYRREFSFYNNEDKSRRISQQKKERLITMVTKENYRIKQAGRLLGISYSTAKKIFTIFRIQLRAKKQPDTGQDQKHIVCLYKEIIEQELNKVNRIQVVSSIAGWMQSGFDNKLFNKQ